MKLALIGYGKMGRAVEEKALNRGHEILLRIDAAERDSLKASDLKGIDAVIEFTRPDSAVANLLLCLEAGCPVVCGTTGWYKEWEKVRAAFLKGNGSLVYATNFSIGVNIFFELNRQLASWMDKYRQYAAGIREIHHTRKLDKPSGTAVTLAEGIVGSHRSYNAWTLKEQVGKDAEGFLPIESLRTGDVVGDHEVTWTSANDSISIHHEAFSRDGFAEGAVHAAEWVIGKNGVFSMSDVLFGTKA